MTVHSRIFSPVDIGTKVAPNHSSVGHLLGAIVRSTAIVLVAGWRFTSILEAKVGSTWGTIDENGRLVLDFVILSKRLVHQFIQYRLFNIATFTFIVEPAAYILFASVVGILDRGKWNERRNMSNTIVIRDGCTVRATVISELGTVRNARGRVSGRAMMG